jgi:hypothetical protein
MDIPPGYWVCACVRRDRAGNLSQIKFNPTRVKRCRKCGCERPPEEFREKDFANRKEPS